MRFRVGRSAVAVASVVSLVACQTLLDLEPRPPLGGATNDAATPPSSSPSLDASTDAGLQVLLTENFDDPAVNWLVSWKESGEGMDPVGVVDGGRALRARPYLDGGTVSYSHEFAPVAGPVELVFEARVRCASLAATDAIRVMALRLKPGLQPVEFQEIGIECVSYGAAFEVFADNTLVFLNSAPLGTKLSTSTWYRVRAEVSLQATWSAGASPGNVRATLTDEALNQSVSTTLALAASPTAGSTSAFVPEIAIGVLEATDWSPGLEVHIDDVLFGVRRTP